MPPREVAGERPTWAWQLPAPGFTGEKGSSHESSESPRSRLKAGILETEEPPAKVTYSVIPEKAGIQDSLNPAPSGTGFRFVLRLLGMTTSPVFESFAKISEELQKKDSGVGEEPKT